MNIEEFLKSFIKNLSSQGNKWVQKPIIGTTLDIDFGISLIDFANLILSQLGQRY